MRIRERRRDRGWLFVFFVLVGIPLLGVSPYIGAANNPNENVRTFMTMAIVEDHTFSLNAVLDRFGWVNDMARVPMPDGGSRFYSVKGPAVSYAGVPVYLAFRKVALVFGHAAPSRSWSAEDRAWWLRAATYTLRLFVVQVPGFFFLVWFERYLRTVTNDLSLRLSAVAAAGLGTNYLAYSQAYVSHALFGVAAFLAFALPELDLRKLPQYRSNARAFLAGTFCGLATLLEYHALPVSVVLADWAVCVYYRPARLASFCSGAALNVIAMMYFQWKAFGSPFMPGHKMVETRVFADQTQQGLFGLKAPEWVPFKELSVDPGFGFFGTSPYMWLGLLAIPFALVLTFGPPRLRSIRRKATFVWVVAMLSLWLALSGAVMWRGGWTIGPRYLGAAPPFFAFGAVCALAKLVQLKPSLRPLWRGMAGGLALSSVLSIGFVGLVYNTLPPDIKHPLVQFAVPMVRAGFVAHHVMEWVGWRSTTFWYVAAGALVSAPLVAVSVRGKASEWAFSAQLIVAAVACWVGLLPQFGKPKKGEGSRTDLHQFAEVWEPSGRDRIASLRAEAERSGERTPCLWYRLADLELSLNLRKEAAEDAKRTATPRSKCPRGLPVL